MKAVLSATGLFVRQIWQDVMLAAVVFVPIFMGLVFRFAVPALESRLCDSLRQNAVISPYYSVFDLALILVTPLMFATVGAMVMLDENDSGTAKALMASPLGKGGYLASRLLVTLAVSMAYGMGAAYAFRLTKTVAPFIPILTLSSGIMGAAVSLAVVTLSHNKVEGMAFTKLSGLTVLGIPAALLVPAPAQYIAAVFPSYWMMRTVWEQRALYSAFGCLAGAIWTLLLWRGFERKMLK